VQEAIAFNLEKPGEPFVVGGKKPMIDLQFFSR
jgi:hypothetical protein